jgi:hypothetical protein
MPKFVLLFALHERPNFWCAVYPDFETRGLFAVRGVEKEVDASTDEKRQELWHRIKQFASEMRNSFVIFEGS